MSQISPPFRIVIVAFAGLLAAWMVFLRPAAEPVVPAPTSTAQPPVAAGGEAAQSAPGAAVEEANAAAAAASEPQAAAAAPPATAAAPAATVAKAAKTAPRAARTDLPRQVRTAIARDKVLVLLFWSGGAADDRLVKAELRHVDRRKGEVVVHAAPMKRFARYQRVTRGTAVEQSPTVVVVDRDRRAETLVGYVDRVSIEQAVTDALRSS